MLDIKFIRENREKVKENCKLRNIECDIDCLLELDEKRRELIEKIDELKNEKNLLNEEMKNAADKEGFAVKGKDIIKETGNSDAGI